MALWPFYKWGIDIAGPFPEGPGKVKKFMWDNIVCRFGLPGEIVSDNDQWTHRKGKPELGTEAVIPAEIGMPTYRTVVVEAAHNDEELRLNLDLLEERRERAAIREAKAKSKMTKHYNARVRDVGQEILSTAITMPAKL
ncbi:reverse transcriptase domain-containing protein [Tanacetum coccineum]